MKKIICAGAALLLFGGATAFAGPHAGVAGISGGGKISVNEGISGGGKISVNEGISGGGKISTNDGISGGGKL
jgi:hypothetical protein